jgi:hypothetical protein
MLPLGARLVTPEREVHLQPNSQVQRSLDVAYVVFARYPRPAVLEASPYRDGDKIFRNLTEAPLRELTGNAIGPYAGCALYTVGGDEDYKHFLPRILEQAVTNPVYHGADPESLADRLQYADWRQWPADEQEAVLSVFNSAWLQASRMHTDVLWAYGWLCGLAKLGEDVSNLLSSWLVPLTIEAALQVACFAMMGEWDVFEATHRTMEAWLSGDEVARALAWASNEVAPGDRWLIEEAQASVAKFRRQHRPS